MLKRLIGLSIGKPKWNKKMIQWIGGFLLNVSHN